MPNDGDQITKISVDTVKTSIGAALTKTGQTYTWQNTINVGTTVSASQILELKTATDKAYDALKLDCPTHNAVNDSADYGDKLSNYSNCTNRTYA